MDGGFVLTLTSQKRLLKLSLRLQDFLMCDISHGEVGDFWEAIDKNRQKHQHFYCRGTVTAKVCSCIYGTLLPLQEVLKAHS